VATGDGDSLAIGGNHFIHLVRRNIDLNLLLFNNQIYGLTKGQFSPTTPMGSITKSSPQGTIEHPFNPGELVFGAQGTFFARVVDTNPAMMTEAMFAAAKHDGTSVIEILQNCVIFNDLAHKLITSKDLKDDHQLHLKEGEPMIFGTNKDKGIILKNSKLDVVKIGENGITVKDILIHDPHQEDRGIHLMLTQMALPAYPIALGVIRSVKQSTYDDLVEEQIKTGKGNSSINCVDDLLNSGDVFDID
jgi:2-oxoglutarate ferredoxin oxidoreductase subunit beta